MIKDKAVLDSICENFIKNTMEFYDIPGMAVGVYVLSDEPYFFNGVGGFRNYKTKEPVQPDTVFHCTSVSKLFTAAGIMKLVDEGKLSLSDKLCDVVPWIRIADKRWEDITIESMLTHTSGLAGVSDYHWEEHRTDENALKDYVLSSEVSDRRLLWKPADNNFRYSCMAYDLLGLVISEVSGISFEEFMQREIFDSLEMRETTFLMPDASLLATPHSKGRDRTIRIEPIYPYTRQHASSSTLKSTTADLLKWAATLIRRVALHEDGIKNIWHPRVEVPDTGEQMGLGWFIRRQSVGGEEGAGREYILVGHEGSDDGFRTSFWICPELGVATVLLCNLTDAPLKKLSKRLFENVIKKPTE